MKKSVVFIAVLVCIGLALLAIVKGNDSKADTLEATLIKDAVTDSKAIVKKEKPFKSDFIYDVGSRFGGIKKSDLNNYTSFADFIGQEHANRIVTYYALNVIVMEGDQKSDVRIDGKGGDFTAEQIKMMQESPYSTNLLIWAEYKGKNKETGALEDTHWTPHITIIPEKQAQYAGGKDALIRYLDTNSKEMRVGIDPEKLKPAKLFFTVTNQGSIKDVFLDRSSGYPAIDQGMIQLLKNAPDLWKAAQNTNGEKVAQQLVISFGLLGC